MKSQAALVSVALLALCCLLIPRGGESAGGILSLSKAGAQLQDESLDDPESEQGLAEDPLGSSTRHKRGAEEAVQAGEWRDRFKSTYLHTYFRRDIRAVEE